MKFRRGGCCKGMCAMPTVSTRAVFESRKVCRGWSVKVWMRGSRAWTSRPKRSSQARKFFATPTFSIPLLSSTAVYIPRCPPIEPTKTRRVICAPSTAHLLSIYCACGLLCPVRSCPYDVPFPTPSHPVGRGAENFCDILLGCWALPYFLGSHLFVR